MIVRRGHPQCLQALRTGAVATRVRSDRSKNASTKGFLLRHLARELRVCAERAKIRKASSGGGLEGGMGRDRLVACGYGHRRGHAGRVEAGKRQPTVSGDMGFEPEIKAIWQLWRGKL